MLFQRTENLLPRVHDAAYSPKAVFRFFQF